MGFGGMKGQVYDMACEIYRTLGDQRFTVNEAAEILNEQNPSAMGARLFAMRNAGAIRVAAIIRSKHRIRSYQFTQRWIDYINEAPAREAKAERKRARAAELHQQRQVAAGVVCNGG